MPLRKIGRIQYGKKKIVLHFTNGEKIALHPDVYVEKSFYLNKEISEDEYQNLLANNALIKDFMYAKNYCLNHNISYDKFLFKLMGRGLDKKVSQAIIEQLIAYHLYDEKDHLNDLMDSYNLNNKGYHYIINNLVTKGFSDALIKTIIYDEDLELSKINNLLPLLIKKYRYDNDQKLSEHLRQSLLRQGFKLDVIKRALNHLPSNQRQDILISLKKDYQKALRLYSKKFSHQALKEKVLKYLMLKGYSYLDIMEVINAID